MTSHEQDAVRQESPGIDTRPLLLIAVVGIFIAVATVGWAWLLLPARAPTEEPLAEPTTPREEVGNIWVYDLDDRALGIERREADLEHLRTYGWVDRRAGIAHIPIDEAMELYVEQLKAEYGRRDDSSSPTPASDAEVRR